MITSSTAAGSTPARRTASWMTLAPSCGAVKPDSPPRYFPMGVRQAESRTGVRASDTTARFGRPLKFTSGGAGARADLLPNPRAEFLPRHDALLGPRPADPHRHRTGLGLALSDHGHVGDLEQLAFANPVI